MIYEVTKIYKIGCSMCMLVCQTHLYQKQLAYPTYAIKIFRFEHNERKKREETWTMEWPDGWWSDESAQIRDCRLVILSTYGSLPFPFMTNNVVCRMSSKTRTTENGLLCIACWCGVGNETKSDRHSWYAYIGMFDGYFIYICWMKWSSLTYTEHWTNMIMEWKMRSGRMVPLCSK